MSPSFEGLVRRKKTVADQESAFKADWDGLSIEDLVIEFCFSFCMNMQVGLSGISGIAYLSDLLPFLYNLALGYQEASLFEVSQ